MINLDTLFSDLLFSLANLTWFQLLDLVLVTVVYYILLNLLRRSRATVLLRGTLFVVAFFFIITVFLPLPTFDYLIQIALIVILIAIPIIFQPELRFLLEELGRTIGSFTLQGATGESTLSSLVRAVGNLAERQIGALIVLEGEDDLQAVRETGVSVGAKVTSELLQSIFYDGTPLHDGAMIIRGERVVAAGCVLPVSNRQLYAGTRRLGTRHRAAVGLTETSDALVLVVSEETGEISIAHQGRLESDVDQTTLREQVYQYYRPPEGARQASLSLSRLWERFADWWRASTRPASNGALSNSAMLLLATLLALATWMFVIQQTNPIVEQRIENVPLRVEEAGPNLQMMSELPDTVTVVAKATDRIIPTLGPSSFRARVDLSTLDVGLHRLEVDVETEARPVQIVSVSPAQVDVQLAGIITSSVPVRVIALGEETLSPALAMTGLPQSEPAEVQITGAEPLVSSVDHARADISIGEASGSFQRLRPLTLVDENGSPVSGPAISPEQVQVTVDIVRRADARDVGVRVVTEGDLPAGYRLSGLSVTPSEVTLIGPEEQLGQLAAAISTFPVNITTAVDDLRIQAPLDLPPGIEALNSVGEPVRSVLVHVDVEPRMANWLRQRAVVIQGEHPLSLEISPTEVNVFLNGPVPTLEEIDASPRLLQVVINAAELEDLQPGESVEIAPEVIHPEGIRVQLEPDLVTVTAR
ncbi:MAG: diadenylate cyclase CdaA [Anaerolineae bacterium]|nr:diadenylate cyclase CdaA [Anaerolineae bacterium]